MTYLEYPLFICGHRKAGTTLLINLFDGARDAVTFPDDSGFFYLYYPRYDVSEYSIGQKIDRLIGKVIDDHLQQILERPVCTKEQAEQLEQKRLELRSRLLGTLPESSSVQHILQHLFENFRQIFYPDITSPVRWIEKTTCTEIYAQDMLSIFPKAKFIQIIRDPRDNWASLKSGWDKYYKDFNDELNRLKQSMIERGRLCMEMAHYNLKTIGSDQYKVVRFEDLTADPERVMRDLTDFAGLKFTPDFLKPTIMRYPWKGNNFEGVSFTTPSDRNAGRWKQRITEQDAALMEFHFRDSMEHFGYEPVFSIKETQLAASNHYKWFNFSTPYSAD